MRLVRAFLLGLVAGAALAFGAALAAAVAAEAAGRTPLHLAVGPVPLLDVVRAPRASETTFGVGLVLAAVAVGVANAIAAALLVRVRGLRDR